MTFRPGDQVSLVKLTNGEYQFTYITENGLISWDDSNKSKEELQLMCDIKGLKVIPYLDLIMKADNIREKRWKIM